MRIMIIGGTSGIGLALANYYLNTGAIVAICGRDLKRVPVDIVKVYPNIQMYEFDVADKIAVDAAIDDFASDTLDLLIVTAGSYFNAKDIQQNPDNAFRMLQTNMIGLNNVFESASHKMMSKKSGHLVAVASIAGLLRDYSGASLYSVTKRAVINICDAYRKALAPFSISVSIIVPGYIDTAKLRDLNGGSAKHKPFLQSEQQAVEHIVKAIERRAAKCVFPWQMHWLIKLFNCLPSPIRGLRKK